MNGRRQPSTRRGPVSHARDHAVRLARLHRIKTEWVKGHAGHAENERVDLLARTAAETAKARG